MDPHKARCMGGCKDKSFLVGSSGMVVASFTVAFLATKLCAFLVWATPGTWFLENESIAVKTAKNHKGVFSLIRLVHKLKNGLILVNSNG